MRAAPALARAFPNITELRYIATGTAPTWGRDTALWGDALWGDTLRYVAFSPSTANGDVHALAKRLGPRARLELVGQFHALKEGSAADVLSRNVKNSIEAITAIDPIGLTINVCRMMESAPSFWDTVARDAIRLRWMQLKPVDYAACVDILVRSKLCDAREE